MFTNINKQNPILIICFFTHQFKQASSQPQSLKLTHIRLLVETKTVSGHVNFKVDHMMGDCFFLNLESGFRKKLVGYCRDGAFNYSTITRKKL